MNNKQQQNKTTPQVKKEMRLPCAGIILFRFNGYDLSLCVCVVAVVVGKRSSRSTRLAQAPKEVGDAQAQATSSSVGQNMARKRGAGGVGSKEHGAESAFWPCVAVWCGSVELQTKKKEGMKKKKGEEKREEGKKKEKRRKRKVAIDKNGLVVACMWCKGSTRDCKVRTSSCTNSTKQLGPPPPPSNLGSAHATASTPKQTRQQTHQKLHSTTFRKHIRTKSNQQPAQSTPAPIQASLSLTRTRTQAPRVSSRPLCVRRGREG